MNNIDNFNFSGKKVIIRVDFNVPLDSNLQITDDTRIKMAVPTIKKVIDNGGSAILMSHLGRPKGVKDSKFSLKHILGRVSELIGTEVLFAEDCIGDAVKSMCEKLKPGEVILLENLRFHPEEKKGDNNFAKELASLADIYINDAFGTAHRKHASTAVIADYFADNKMFGYIMQNEILALNKVVKNVERPFTAVIGGAKVSTKLTVIENLLSKVDNLIIGGAMSFTFIKANGGNIGKSLVEEDYIDKIQNLYDIAKSNNATIYLPVDSLNTDKFDKDAHVTLSDIDKIPDNLMGLDVGPKTNAIFKKILLDSKTILWNGPVGVFEFDKFANGTKEIALTIVEATSKGTFSVVGGGDSLAALSKFEQTDKVSYVSTGGGALLEYIEGKELPGIVAIKDN